MAIARLFRRGATKVWMEKYVFPLLTLVALAVIWEVAVGLGDVPEYILPAPSVIVEEIVDQARVIFNHSLVTLGEVILGFLLSVVVAIPLGVAIHYSPFLARVFYPLLVASQTVPKIAIAPLLVIWFGFGLAPKVLIAFLIAFFPIVIDTVVGLRRTEEEMVYLVRSMGANRLQIFLKLSLPNALPSIFGGLKVAITLAVVGAVVGEFLAADSGLGYMLVVANGYLDTALVFAGIIALSVIGIVLFFIVELLERLIVPWEAKRDDDAARATM